MEALTIKDFVLYNNPCKICIKPTKTVFSLKIFSREDPFDGSASCIFPLLKENNLYFSLHIKYGENLGILINPINNYYKIVSQSSNSISKLLADFFFYYDVALDSRCKICQSEVQSDFLEFDSNYIKPVNLFHEQLNIFNETHEFTITTNFTNQKSFIVANLINQKNQKTFSLETSALPLFKIKNRDQLLKKLKLYMTFS